VKIVCISDTHCQLKQIDIPHGDCLVHAGDALSSGVYSEWVEFLEDFKKLPHEYKIYVPGNHDRITELNEDLVKKECADAGVIYLNNLGVTLEGIKFWGSAITPRFHNWAWNRDSGTSGTSYGPLFIDYDPIKPYWDLIPEDIDVLITHGPPKGILDVSVYDGKECGCNILRDKVEVVNPKYHIFGHIHNWHGTKTVGPTTFINASNCTEKYKPTNKPIVVEIENE